MQAHWNCRVTFGLACRTLASGKPFDISTGLDDNRDTVANDRPPE